MKKDKQQDKEELVRKIDENQIRNKDREQIINKMDKN